MKFINTTKNSVYLEDINLSISYIGDTCQSLGIDLIKKSKSFQKLVSIGCFKIVELEEDDRVARNLLKISNNYVSENIINAEIDRREKTSKMEALIRGHFYDNTGYAKVNRNLAFTLYRKGLFVEIDPVTNNSCLNEMEAKVLQLLRKPACKGYVHIDSVIPTQSKVSKNYNILYTTTECDLVPNQFIEVANTYDQLWVTSNFCKKSFENSGYKKEIKVIHPVINCNLYKNEVSKTYNFRPDLKKFSFLSVHTWGYRKGSEALVRSFCEAFTEKDEVSLVLLLSEKSIKQQNKIKEEIRDILSKYPNKPHILVTMNSVPEYQMPSFYRSFDAFVSCSRGEGFNLPACEASLCGLPVIATNYSGHLDFLNKNNSSLVDIDDFEIAEKGSTGVHYWDGQRFPKLKSEKFIKDFAEAMKNVYNNYEECVLKNNILKNFIISNFNGDKTGENCYNIIKSIW